MHVFKKAMVTAMACLMLLSAFSFTGCSKFAEAMERQRAENETEEARKFETENEFFKYYNKRLLDALANKDNAALKELFCETVIDNAADLDEGIEYVLELEDWSTFSAGADNCSSLKEFGGGRHWRYYSARTDLNGEGAKYKMYFTGYGWYYDEAREGSDYASENVGLVNLYLCKLDDNGDTVGFPYTEINGVYHSGREPMEGVVTVILNSSSSVKDVDAFMSQDLLDQADKDALDAFYEFAGLDPKRKKNAIFFFMYEQDGGYVISTVVYTKWGDNCMSILIKDGLIIGVTLSEDENMEKPKAGEIKGFEIVYG